MTATPNSLQLALLSAAILGFRHGFDYDHIAAISDITSVQTSRWRGMRLGLLYAVGHAATVTALGSAVIVFQLSLPHGIDRIAERLVGLTLLILGVYVLGSLFTGRPAPPSRFHLMAGALRWVHWKIKSYWHDHDVPRPADKTWNYSAKSVLMIGVVHGLGAETPSQLMIFLLAAIQPSNETLDSISGISRSRKLLFVGAMVLVLLCAPVPQSFLTYPI